MDAAKLASVLVTDEYGVKELLDDPGRAKKCVPIILIPTTAGTGAEVTPNAIVAVPEQELKVGIVNENMIADYVILDARMIKNLPRKIAASTGVDALAHCIECFTSNKANPFSDLYALEGLDLILNNIEKACDDPEAMTEKNRMQIAAYYGGLAITASGTTAVHALSYPLGGKIRLDHQPSGRNRETSGHPHQSERVWCSGKRSGQPGGGRYAGTASAGKQPAPGYSGGCPRTLQRSTVICKRFAVADTHGIFTETIPADAQNLTAGGV